MKLLGKTTVNGKGFTISDSNGTVYPKQLGLSDSWYGGYVKELRKTMYGIYLCLTRKGEVVNLGYTDESLTDAGRELLGLIRPPEEPPEEEQKKTPQKLRKELIEKAKELGIEGKIATMSSAKLNELIEAKLSQ